MNTILLSAGFGTRFRPFTNHRAKPAIPFLNLPFIGYSLFYAQKFGCSQATINLHHLPQTVKDAVASINDAQSCLIKYLIEAPEILDSGGGILNAQAHLETSENFLVFNTDSPHVFPDLNFDELLERHNSEKALCTFVTCKVNSISSQARGIWTNSDSHFVQHIGERNNKNHHFEHYVGLMVLSRRVFNYFNEHQKSNILYDVVLPALQFKKEKALTYCLNDYIPCETGNLSGYLDASFKYTDYLMDHPESPFATELTNILDFFNLKPHLFRSKDCKILTLNKDHLDEDFQLSGHIILDKNTQLNDQFRISNSVLTDQTKIVSNISNNLVL